MSNAADGSRFVSTLYADPEAGIVRVLRERKKELAAIRREADLIFGEPMIIDEFFRSGPLITILWKRRSEYLG